MTIEDVRDHDVAAARREALPLRTSADLNPLLARIGDARLVLIGEASHGTHEFYAWRAELTRRLIVEKGFGFIGVEGDWPDCHTVHCSVTAGRDAPGDPRDPLLAFDRWPRWMWANAEVLEFARWLCGHNTCRPPQHRAGFHGLDVYSLFASLRAVLDYLAEHEPDQLPVAREAVRCFEPYGENPQSYALASRLVPTSCENEVVALLTRLRRPEPLVHDGGALDARFVAEQNAAAAAEAERYYRAMVRGGPESWNIRDCHMADTLDRLLARYSAGDDTPAAKAVVWEHNTHIGDARATDMATAGMVNVGQLVRERHGPEHVVLIGFGTHRGSVIASPHWGGPVREMPVPPAPPDTLEGLLHEATGGTDAAFILTDHPSPAPGKTAPGSARSVGVGWPHTRHRHRAIGVVYNPDDERRGNYVPTVLGARYDAFLFCDQTTALRPLHPIEPPDLEPETYPTGE
jgi:erythromycin esterase